MGFKSVAGRFNAKIEDLKKAKKLYYHIHIKPVVPKNFPKILLFDIETSPMKVLTWGRWKQNIYLNQTIDEWFMIAWSAKWLYDPNIMGSVLTPEEALNKDDSRITKEIWTLLDEADIIIGHNSKQFDTPKLNSRFIINGLTPPSPYRQIDTKEISARQFGFSSNKLDALAGYFNIEHKDDTNFQLWVDCLDGKQEALDYMLKYNKKDVAILEEVYLHLRPWAKNHPNLSVYLETHDTTCPYCASKNLHTTGDYHFTQVNKYEVLRCEDCGGISRKRLSSLTVNKKKNLVTSI